MFKRKTKKTEPANECAMAPMTPDPKPVPRAVKFSRTVTLSNGKSHIRVTGDFWDDTLPTAIGFAAELNAAIQEAIRLESVAATVYVKS